MGIILTSTGLPLLTSARGVASPMRVPVPRPDPESEIPLEGPASSITYRGVTFNFSTPVKYLWSANGDPVVISSELGSGGTSITSITPDSTNKSGTWANGAEINPGNDGNPALGQVAQGMDALVATGTNPPGFTYKHALNKDPGASGAINIAQGSQFTVVKSVRDSTSPGSARWIQKYVVLTIVNSRPPSKGTWFRPGVPGAKKTWEHKKETVEAKLGALRALTRPSGVSKVATVLDTMTSSNLHTRPLWWSTSEHAGTVQLTGESGTYAGLYGPVRALEFLSLHSVDTSINDKRDLAVIFTQYGIDLIENYRQNNQTKGRGAGQWYGYIYYPYLAGFLLDDQSILNDARKIKCNEVNQIFWVQPDAIGMGEPKPGAQSLVGWVPTPSQNRWQVDETFFAEDLGLPEWSSDGWDPGAATFTDPKAGASMYRIYRNFSFENTRAIMAIGLLQNGPGGQTGDVALRGGGAADTANIRAAAIAYMDRVRTWLDYYYYGQKGMSATTRAIINAWRGSIPTPVWSGRPDIPADQSATSDVSAGKTPDFTTKGQASGVVAYNFTQRDYTTTAITKREVQYSLDNIQFTPETPADSGASGTISGLRTGCQHYCRWRQRNAAGWSKWSPTWPLEVKPTTTVLPEFRGLVVTAGPTSGSAPAFTTAPKLHFRPYPAWTTTPPYSTGDTSLVPTLRVDDYYYAPITAFAQVSDRRLYAGCGYLSGGGTPTSIAYQWQKDSGGNGVFATISGQTSVSYSSPVTDRGSQIRCHVTVNTTNGPVSALTNAITVT